MSDKTSKQPSASRKCLPAVALIILAGVAVYLNSFGGPFIFDDPESISENPSIRRLWDIKEVLSPPAHGQAVQRRPVANLSLAINYAIGGLDVRGYHVFNLSVHILAALTLFGVVRRTLESPRVGESIKKVSTPLGLLIGAIWVVHPLHTDAVTYIIQRTELLAGLFYLLSLYCVIRGNGSNKKQWWYITAVISCALGMGSKEVMVSAPVVILIYDRVFLSCSFREVFNRRWGLYAALAGTWVLTAVLIPHGSEGSAVFGKGTASLAYASGQFEVITNYLRLCFWPRPLILDYGLYDPTSLRQALPYAVFVSLLLMGTVLGLYYRAWTGFLGVWFFAILAPSSSFVPVMAQASAEKRMYLPLAAVVTMVVVCVYVLGRRVLYRLMGSNGRRAGQIIGYTVAGAAIVILAGLTVRRNYDYRSELAIWQDTINKRPNNTRAYNNRGLVYRRMEKYDRAINDFNRAAKLKPDYAKTYNNRGLTYWSMGKPKPAIRDFNEAISLNPSFARAYYNRAEVYREKNNYRKAIRDLNKAIELGLENARVYNSRGLVHQQKKEMEPAIRDFRQALRLKADYSQARNNLEQALSEQNRTKAR
ncbi:MAG: tetratricopeptide repeat protein [Actinobacteria bacterium]|nr:tetratricopeptide repeat protein [Actinomycetota bacterium]